MKKRAFTLSEVLITFGIIGLIAALTIPNLMGAYRKRVVETRLKKFYSAINQAIMLSENENGDKKDWVIKDTEEFWNLYLKKYLNHTNTEDSYNASRKCKRIYFEDGSSVIIDIYFSENEAGEVTWQTSGGHFVFCPEAKYCKDTGNTYIGTKKFTFGFWPNQTDRASSFAYHKNKGVEPYMVWWDGNPTTLYTHSAHGCNSTSTTNKYYCTAIIQRNGWRIPDDYPFKF